MDISPANNKSTKKGISKGQKKLLVALLAIIVVAGAFLCTYKLAYNKGYKAGEAAEKKSAEANASKATDIFKNLQSPFNTVSGVVTELKGDTLKVDASNGEKKEIKLTDSTKITKGSDTLNRDALKKDVKVTVFTSGSNAKDKNLTATRIVVR